MAIIKYSHLKFFLLSLTLQANLKEGVGRGGWSHENGLRPNFQCLYMYRITFILKKTHLYDGPKHPPNAYECVKNFVVLLLYTRQFFSLNTNYILFLINNAVFENLGFTVHIAFILRGYLVTSSMIYKLFRAHQVQWFYTVGRGSVHKYLRSA